MLFTMKKTRKARKTPAAATAIRVDQEVYDAIQKRAVPLKDSPNSVLRRVLRVGRKKSDEGRANDPKAGENPDFNPVR